MPNCQTKYCRNSAISSGKCSTCRSREWRKNNPIRYAYNTIKSNAKRRGKDFRISFEDFKLFVSEVPYLAKKGITATSWHIDRIDETIGYTIENIQVMSNAQNVRKYMEYKWNEQTREMEFDTQTLRDEPINTPF